MHGPMVFALMVALVATLPAGCAHARPSTPAESAPDLRSLHLRRTSADARGDEFVFIEPVGEGVRIRAVRVSSANDVCPSPTLVEAAEITVPATTVQALAMVPACSLTPGAVRRAMSRARGTPIVGHFLGSFEAVIADCGGVDRIFEREMPPIVDDDRLRRQAPDVAALWRLLPRLQAQAMDMSPFPDAFVDASPEVQARRAALGAALVPSLRSGRYSDYLQRELAGYTGRATRNPTIVELLHRDTLPLVGYTTPYPPPQAIASREFGDVRLRLTVVRTGEVSAVAVLDDRFSFLSEGAVEAARQWRFAPGALPAGEIDITLRFTLHCE
jgi:TonB family protein